MNVAPISMASVARVNSTFNGKEKKAEPAKVDNQPQLPEGKKIVWHTWGDNYAYPTIEDVEETKTEPQQEKKAPQGKTETPEEYYKRKLYSPEWCM